MFVMYVDKNYDLTNKEYIKFNIDWEQANIMKKECKV